MKNLLIAVAGLALAACGVEAPSSEQVCNEMVANDAKAERDIRRDGVELTDLCSCFGKTVDAMPDAQKASHIGVMTAVTAIRTANKVGVEEAAEQLEDELRSGVSEHAFTEDDFENTGKLLNDLGNRLEDGGTCQAA